MKRLIRAAILGGIIVFLVEMFAWKVFPGIRAQLFRNPEAVATVIKENVATDGVYVLRSRDQISNTCSFPHFFGTVLLKGRHSQAATRVIGLITQIVLAGCVSWILLQTTKLRFGKKVGLITVIGFIIAISREFQWFNWAGFPLEYALIHGMIQVISWFLAGLGMARVLK